MHMGVTVSVISGKGGTGKTTLCAGIAACLAAEGKRVLCIDADIGLRNLDIALGMAEQPAVAFTDVTQGFCKLSGGVAVIRVGAQTETAMKEQKLRVEDALNATRAAVEEGIVAGGGTAFVNAIPAVEKLVAKLSGDEKTGASIIVKALQAPVRQIAENAGVDGSVVFEKIKNSRKVGFGYNAYSATYCDMIPAGIVDPTKVTRTALENAASIGACVLTTESIVADKPDPAADAAAAAAANAGGMGGMY